MDRYWVGGTASWDATAGTKWALTDGGAGGQAVPTATDDVFFTALSGAVTVTLATSTFCANLNFTGFTGTFTRSAGTLSVTGNLIFSAGMTLGAVPLAFENSVGVTLTTAGKVLSAPLSITCFGTTASVTLQDAFSSTSSIIVNTGTFTTNNYAVTATQLSSNNGNVRTINLGSSTVTLSATAGTINFNNNAGLVFNAGTSTIVCSGAGSNINSGSTGNSGSGVTFYNVSYTSTLVSTHALLSINTFNNITVAGPTSAGVTQVTFDSRQTINGTLSTTGTAGNRRVWFRSNTYGIAQTLTINSAPSLTDADFRDIYVVGTAAPISGTRIGDLRGIRGITADAPKTVYWNLAGTQNWTADGWCASSGGTPSIDNYPLAQDIAVFNNAGAVAQIVLNAAAGYVPTIDCSTRTTAMTVAFFTSTSCYGDITMGSGVSTSSNGVFTFSGRNTQTITSAGKQLNCVMTIDSYGGTVQLADALNIATLTLTVTNGTFDTKNYNVTAGSLSSSNANVRAINLGSSTVTLSNFLDFTNSTNLSFDCGTSTVIFSASSASPNFGGRTFYDLSFTSGNNSVHTITGGLTCNNISTTAPSSAGLRTISIVANLTVNGTLTVDGATAVRRIFVRSSVFGTPRTLTVNSLSATDCDFRDIDIEGAAAGSSPVRAGDCGGNTGITFPAAKTVYWNLAGAQNWSSTAWAPGSGGTPDINNFPLAQDTAVFDDTGSAGTVNFDASWNVGTLNASARTTAMTLNPSTAVQACYGNWTIGTGVTQGPNGTVTFSGRGTSIVTSNGVAFNCNLIVNCFTGTVQLADALTINTARTLTLTSGTFDAVTYNVTVGAVSTAGGSSQRVKMGSGTWTLSGTGNVWSGAAFANTTAYFEKGTANIVLSDTSTTARTFTSGASSVVSFNKLTIGGTTGTSTLTITGDNTFTELDSAKTVAHTIALGTSILTFGKWSVTGTAGNVVTVTGTAAITIAGARVSGVDYLAMNGNSLSNTSPGEFYSGANSTGTGANIIKTAAPSPVTRYWVGGTGTWDATTTTKWSASSGGAGGASVPTSADAVVFDALSSATAYTVTCTATQLRCADLIMDWPTAGVLTWAGTAPIAFHGSVQLYNGIRFSRTYTGTITLSGSITGNTFATDEVALASAIAVNGVGCGWTLGNALDIGSSILTVTNGSFTTANYATTAGALVSSNANTRSLSFGSSVITIQGTTLDFSNSVNFAFNSDTSTINCTTSLALIGGNQTFYNVSLTNASISIVVTISGTNTFNNLSVTGAPTSSGVRGISFFADQTINGTLTLAAGTNATMRTFLRSNVIGTTRTLTCAAVAAPTDIDFRDITIAGAAAPVSGTRLGDCKGNSGITFDAAKTVYWVQGSSANWSDTAGWSFTDGGSADVTAFPLTQDAAVFKNPVSGRTVTINAAYNIGTIDMSDRTTNTMTLATGSTAPTIYGNWINGTGITLSGTGALTFAGRGSQTITSAGKAFPHNTRFDSVTGSVALQDAFTSSNGSTPAISLFSGTLDLNGYNMTIASGGFWSTTTTPRTLAIGLGTLTVGNSGPSFDCLSTVPPTITGTGTISMTNAAAKTFAGGGIQTYPTLNQGGAGALTISGNNTFANITNTYSATGATSILLGTTTQTVGTWGASGDVGNVLTVSGTSASSPATLVVTGTPLGSLDYLTITGVRAYPLETTWYAGANSTNNGSLGWYFVAGVSGNIYNVNWTDTPTATDTFDSTATFTAVTTETATNFDIFEVAASIFNAPITETSTATDSGIAYVAFQATVNESGTAVDVVQGGIGYTVSVAEIGSATDSILAGSGYFVFLDESGAVTDTAAAQAAFASTTQETATSTDANSAVATFTPAIQEVGAVTDAVPTTASMSPAVDETSTATDTDVGFILFPSAVTEVANITDFLLSGSGYFVVLDESAAATDDDVGYISFPGVVDEASTASDTDVGFISFPGNIAETASPVDNANAPGSTYNAQFGGLSLSTSVLPLGQSYFGSQFLVPGTAPSPAVQVVANGTGTGTSGGFNAGGNYILYSFPPGTSGGTLSTTVLDLSNFSSVTIDVIRGNGSNGGNAPPPVDFSVQIVLGGTGYGIGSIGSSDSSYNSFKHFTCEIPLELQIPGVRVTFSTYTTGFPVSNIWGIRSITLNSIGATATDTTNAPGSTYNPRLTEAATATDATAGSLAYLAAITEAVTATDVPSSKVIFRGFFADTATGTDTPSSAAVFYVALSETATATDIAAVAASIFNANLAELSSAADTLAPAATYNSSVLVLVTISDAVVGAYLWNPIDDTQDANWQNVGTVQAPGWTAVDTTQLPGWVNIEI